MNNQILNFGKRIAEARFKKKFFKKIPKSFINNPKTATEICRQAEMKLMWNPIGFKAGSPMNPAGHLHSNAVALAWFSGHRTVTHSTPATYSAVPFKLAVCPQLNAHSRSHTSSPNTVGISRHSLLSAQSTLLLQAASSSAHMSVQLKRLSRHVPPLLHGLGSQRA